MPIQQAQWSPPDHSPALAAFVLENAATRMVVVPERGGKIVSLYDKQAQEEWLWFNKALPWRPPSPDDSYVAAHDLGGWDECFPTVAPTTVQGRRWPDHGDLWWRPWESRIQGDSLWTGVTGDGYRFERTIRPTQTGFLLNYTVTNLTQQPFLYLWCAHPLFHLNEPLSLEIIGRPPVRLGDHNPTNRSVFHRWPIINERNFQQVGKQSGTATKLFVALDEGRVNLCRRDGIQLEMRWPIDKASMLGLWINEGGWHGAGNAPYFNLGVEPASGAPDDLAVALQQWQCAQTLAPGDTQTWWLQLKFIAGE